MTEPSLLKNVTLSPTTDDATPVDSIPNLALDSADFVLLHTPNPDHVSSNLPSSSGIGFVNSGETSSGEILGDYLPSLTERGFKENETPRESQAGLQKIANFIVTTEVNLNLRNCELDDESMECVGKHLQATLRNIDLSYNNVMHIGCSILLPFLEKLSLLRVLHLSFCPIEDDGVAIIARHIPNLPSITELSLRRCLMTFLGAEKLAYAIVETQTLQTLNISFNNIGQRGASVIAKAIYKNKTLQRVKLESCDIGTQGGIYMAYGSSGSKTLTHLYLAFNGIEEKAANAFSKVLSLKTCPLTFLDLGNNHFAKETATLILAAARRKDGAVDVRIMGPKLNSTAYRAVKERIISLKSHAV